MSSEVLNASVQLANYLNSNKNSIESQNYFHFIISLLFSERKIVFSTQEMLVASIIFQSFFYSSYNLESVA